ncbi:MAG: hypothetical protein EZS28_010534 [Streblomastix strix]|uniref:Uncharacterized protein n=1 Tax=Streblomastix strix TaxID=222440 RepID=A0A5J4WG92_9EUKA|nr:MAG: hypothetical protein EZS28_010534 [Streblomastix strix]
MSKQGTSPHHHGYGERQIEERTVIQKHVSGENITISDWCQFRKGLDTDLKLGTVGLQSQVSYSENQSRKREQRTCFQITR